MSFMPPLQAEALTFNNCETKLGWKVQLVTTSSNQLWSTSPSPNHLYQVWLVIDMVLSKHISYLVPRTLVVRITAQITCAWSAYRMVYWSTNYYVDSSMFRLMGSAPAYIVVHHVTYVQVPECNKHSSSAYLCSDTHPAPYSEYSEYCILAE